MTTNSQWVWLVVATCCASHAACSSQESKSDTETSALDSTGVTATTAQSPESATHPTIESSATTAESEPTVAPTSDETTTAAASSSGVASSPRATSEGEGSTREVGSEVAPSEQETSDDVSATTSLAPSTTGAFTGACNPSVPTGAQARGSGPHEVIIETNSDVGVSEGTIFRPSDLGGDEKYPIFVWGQGGCSQDGMSNSAAMAEIASHGYFVIADGTPGGTGNRTMDRADLAGMGAPLMAYVDWAIGENAKPCSIYYESMEPSKVASNGFSCGGLMAQGTVLDPRIVTWGVTSSGMAGATQSFYDEVHTPVLFVEGGVDDVAYEGGLEGYEKIVALGVPVMWFDTARGHGGDLFQANGGDFTKINLAWLNWWLKGDETATGKGLLVGAECPYCSDAAWDVRSANLP